MAKSSTSFQKGNPGGGRPRLTEAEQKARDALRLATPLAVTVILEELQQRGPEKLKSALAVLERVWGKPASAPEDREAISGASEPAWVSRLPNEVKLAVAQIPLADAEEE